MSAIIELFDEEPLENIASHLLYPRSKLVFIGYQRAFTKRRRRGLERFLSLRGVAEPPEYIKVDPQNLPAMLDALEAVVLREPDCCFDLTGGEDLALVAMGILSERHKLPMYRMNPRSGEMVPVLGKLPPLGEALPMTVRQLAILYGGDVLRGDDDVIPLTDELREVVSALRLLCVSDRSLLNRAAALFNSLAGCTVELDVSANIILTRTARGVLTGLLRIGLLENLSTADSCLSFSYRDALVKRLLTKGGLTLELMVRIAAEDSGVFSDVRQGVVLDWDGVVSETCSAETRNEADVVLMRGMTPIFISCKNGDVKKEALYELEVVAERFGGAYAKKALVCSALTGAPTANESLRRRARDMGVTLIENAYTLTEKELAEAVGKLR